MSFITDMFTPEFAVLVAAGLLPMCIGWIIMRRSTHHARFGYYRSAKYLWATAWLFWWIGLLLIISGFVSNSLHHAEQRNQPQIQEENHLKSPAIMEDESNAP